MTPTRRTALLSVAALAALAACGDRPAPRGAVPGIRAPETDAADAWSSGLRRLATEENADVKGTVAGLWAFADRFAEVVGRDRNTVFSPASIGYAFGMLRGGAGGSTARQLDGVFRFPRSVHDAFGVMRRDIVTTGGPPSASSKAAVVAIANGLFLADGFDTDQAYRRLLDRAYDSEVQHVDFTSGEAKRVIDAWVAEQTAGRITELFDKLKRDTIAVLANAVYLKALWQTQLDAGQTQPEPFRLLGGGSAQAPVMRVPKPDRFRYARGKGWHAVELPYQGGELGMWLLVPTEGLQPPRITAGTLAALGAAEQKFVDFALPRWDFGTDIELLGPLRKLGFTALGDLPAFGPEAFVDQAIHRANVTVDESGTEAAAVTGIAIRVSAPQVEAVVRADRPFTFAVVHRPTGTPLFVGTVTDPTQS